MLVLQACVDIAAALERLEEEKWGQLYGCNCVQQRDSAGLCSRANVMFVEKAIFAESPDPVDHIGLLIYVKLLSSGTAAQVSFNRVVERLKRIGAVHVNDNPLRHVMPNFVTSASDCKTGWGEFQQHRKVIGLICVGFSDQETNQVPNGDSRHHSTDESASSDSAEHVPSFAEQYQLLKDHYRSTLVDARCITVGPAVKANTKTEQHATTATSMHDGLLSYSSLEEASQLELDVRDYLRALYWVLEGRRLDLSFEKQDFPPCPLAPDEEKYMISIDRNSRGFRKRCVGRLKKQVADVTVMTGLPLVALDCYNAAIENLKSTNDWLWLAGAYEGYACAAILAKFGTSAFESNNTLHRVPTFTSGQMKKVQSDRNSSPVRPTASPQQAIKNSVIKSISAEEIEEKFKLAIENYQKFSFAACIECECAFKATSLYLLLRRYEALDEFLNMYCGRFLDESFKMFSDLQKSQICNLVASIYKSIGFRRKMSFFTRLAALFRLSLNDQSSMSPVDYRQVYPLLLNSLGAYRIPWGDLSDSSSNYGKLGGWPAVQIRALHETYAAAQRSNYREAAARHLAHMIQVVAELYDDELLRQFCGELMQLTTEFGTHNISTPLHLNCGAILPPVQLTKLPKFLSIEIKPLPASLTPCEKASSEINSVFIYSPFQNTTHGTRVRWVNGCTGIVTAMISNSLPIKLQVKNLTLIGDGVPFDGCVTSLELMPKARTVSVKLYATPKEAGALQITGYTCEIMGVKMVTRFDDIPWLRRIRGVVQVEVLPALPELQLYTNLPRAVNQLSHEPTEICNAEIRLFVGQTVMQSIELMNVSDVPIDGIRWELQQSSRLTPVICIDKCDITLPFVAKTSQTIQFSVSAIDPSSIKDVMEKGNDSESIPYTGRVLIETVKFIYWGGAQNSLALGYQRCCSLTIYVTIVPVVIVEKWHVLPGETCNNRYIALDVMNAADNEVDIDFPAGRSVTIQPRDVCRVPVLFDCCDLTHATTEQAIRGPKAKQYLEQARRKYIQAHVLKTLNIKWSVTNDKDIFGDVPIGALLNSPHLCDDLMMPLMTVDVRIENSEVLSSNEHAVGIAEQLTLHTTIVYTKHFPVTVKLYLRFYRDFQNGITGSVDDDVVVVGSGMHRLSLDESATYYKKFQFLFCHEGTYKLQVACDVSRNKSTELSADASVIGGIAYDESVFGSPVLPVLLFNVVSKNIQVP